jgi:hypothetical protein
MVRERFGWVRLISNARNRGFAAANNQELVLASGRNVLFLNPDTVVHAGALEVLVRALDGDPHLGACGPQLLSADGSIQPSARRFPTFAALLHQYTPLRALKFLKGAYRRYKMADFDFRTPADVDSLMGAALCVPQRVLAEVGIMDERFFVYLEEVDLCRRIREAGYRIRFEPSGRLTHLGGVSAASSLRSRSGCFGGVGSATANVLFCRSLFRYLRKHGGPFRGAAMAFVLRLGMFLREAALLVGNLIAALVLLLVGRTARAQRRLAGAASAARFLCRDGWLTFLKA